jgi:hypothetical protein
MLGVVQGYTGSRGWMSGIGSAFNFSEMKGGSTPLIINHPLMDSRLDFIDFLLADLKLETEIEDSNEGTEMLVIAIFGKATLKDSGGDEQRPHRPC